MKRLIWKEWREKWLWLLVFVTIIVSTSLLAHTGLSYGGKKVSPWIYVIVFPTLLLGLSTFSREMGYECQDFIFSRAIGWKKLLGAKMLTDAIIMLLAIIVGAVVFCLRVPSDYIGFLGFGRLLLGIGIAFGIALIGYLPGFGTSTVLPGMLGGGLVLCIVFITIGIESVILGNFTFRKYADIDLLTSWVPAIIVTSMIIAKRGLGLTVKERTKKYMKYELLAKCFYFHISSSTNTAYECF